MEFKEMLINIFQALVDDKINYLVINGELVAVKIAIGKGRNIGASPVKQDFIEGKYKREQVYEI